MRRGRYAVAIFVSALIFCTLGWNFAAPPAEMSGVSLVAWGNQGIGSTVMLTVLLLIAVALCSLLVHPDSPHMGLFCALVGMVGLSIRGGSIHMLLQYAQQTDSYPRMSQMLAIECVQWFVIVLVAESFARLLHDRFFANTHWITRSGPDLAQDTSRVRGVGTLIVTFLGISHAVRRLLQTEKMGPLLSSILSAIFSGPLAFLFLYGLMQSPAKGQVLLACYFSFYLASIFGCLAFPKAPIISSLLTVPLVALAGYVLGMHMTPPYPGHASFFAIRALPIDYIVAGSPGAILGFYSAFQSPADQRPSES
jgi:hypothetical protein